MSVRAGILVTGTEVLTGRVTDRNGPWLADRLEEAGVEAAQIAIVGDRRQDMLAALRFMAEQGLELIVTSGGLGPTADDLTAEVVGEFQGREMVLDEALEGRIAAILAGIAKRWPNIDMDAVRASNRKQAIVPRGATILEPVGTAPGLVVPPGSTEGGEGGAMEGGVAEGVEGEGVDGGAGGVENVGKDREHRDRRSAQEGGRGGGADADRGPDDGVSGPERVAEGGVSDGGTRGVQSAGAGGVEGAGGSGEYRGGVEGAGGSGEYRGGVEGAGGSGEYRGGVEGAGGSGEYRGGVEGAGGSGEYRGGVEGAGGSGEYRGGVEGAGGSGEHRGGVEGAGGSGEHRGGVEGAGEGGVVDVSKKMRIAPAYVRARDSRRGEGPTVLVLPGPPRELQPMWSAALETDAMRAALADAVEYRRHTLRLFGIPESEIAETLRAAERDGIELERLEITTCLRRGEVEVVTRYEPPAQPVYDAFVALVRARHADTLFSDDGSTVDEQVAALLRGESAGEPAGAAGPADGDGATGGRRQTAPRSPLTIATAESCTGGLLAARLTELPGSSGYVRGALVAYANDVKTAAAGVPAALIEAHGAVSPEVAAALAQGARERLCADVGVGVTGIAGPGGGSEQKPVGLVCFSVAGPGAAELTRSVQLPGGRADVRDRATTVALHLVRRALAAAPA